MIISSGIRGLDCHGAIFPAVIDRNIWTPEREEAFRQFRDHGRFCAETLKIRTETGETVPLILQPGQVALTQQIERQMAAGRPVRGVVLKARQVRMSVGACSHIFKRSAFLPGQQSLIFGDLHKSARNLWGYVRQFDQSYRGAVAKLETTRVVQDHRIEWGSSWVEVASAETVTSGRSYSLRHLLLSEYAFYRDPASLMTGLLQSVPDDPDTTVIVESTACGYGGPFWEMWQRASDASTRSGWFALFFAWWQEPKYARRLEQHPGEFEVSLTTEEQAMRRAYSLSLEQLWWRRWAIAEKCEGSEDRFRQEYPSNPEEAFLTSGRPRFDIISLGRQILNREPLNGDLETIAIGREQRIILQPRQDRAGLLDVFRRPVEGHQYCIGADPAQGIDAGEGSGRSDPDYSVAAVLDAESGELVARLRGRLVPSEFGRYLCDLGRWYNWAYLTPEANPIGIALIEEILRQHYPMERIYWRRRDPSDRRPVKLEELGYLTSEVSKPQLISALDRALREMSVIIPDAATLAELRTYVVDARGKVNAAPGAHDDCVIAVALALQGLKTMPREKPKTNAPTLAIVDYRSGRRVEPSAPPGW